LETNPYRKRFSRERGKRLGVMAALAIRRIPEFVPEEIEEEIEEQPVKVIGAHADYCREDFIFPRMQSRTMRETPWAARQRPLKSWGEIAGVGLIVGLASCVLVVGTAVLI
jgi:hypothetical protein